MAEQASTLDIIGAMVGMQNASPSSEFAAIAHVLVADRDAALKRFRHDHSDGAKRESVRLTLVTIEGLMWQLKRYVASDPEKMALLSIHEQAALAEETYAIAENGNLKIKGQTVPTEISIKFLARLLQRFQTEYTIDFSTPEAKQLSVAIRIRNRLTHPKSLVDLEVSNLEMLICEAAFYWFTAVALFVLEGHKADIKAWMSHLPAGTPLPSFFRLSKTENS